MLLCKVQSYHPGPYLGLEDQMLGLAVWIFSTSGTDYVTRSYVIDLHNRSWWPNSEAHSFLHATVDMKHNQRTPKAVHI